MLEDHQGIAQDKGHHKIFMVAIPGVEGRLPFTSFSYLDEVLGTPED